MHSGTLTSLESALFLPSAPAHSGARHHDRIMSTLRLCLGGKVDLIEDVPGFVALRTVASVKYNVVLICQTIPPRIFHIHMQYLRIKNSTSPCF